MAKKRTLKCKHKGCKFKTAGGKAMGEHYAKYPKHAGRYYKPNSEIQKNKNKNKKVTVQISKEATPVDLKFCPCCGTSLKYVIQALQMGD